MKSPNPAGAKKGISGTLVVKVVKVKQISYGGDETSRSPPKKVFLSFNDELRS